MKFKSIFEVFEPDFTGSEFGFKSAYKEKKNRVNEGSVTIEEPRPKFRLTRVKEDRV